MKSRKNKATSRLSGTARAALLAGAVGVLLGVAVAPAGAATAWGQIGNIGSALGISYNNQAGVDNSSKWAATVTSANTNAPVGYIGSRGRLFNGSSICSDPGTTYNNVAASSHYGYSTFGVSCGSGARYSYGVSYFYNGSGYNAAYTFQSPSLNF